MKYRQEENDEEKKFPLLILCGALQILGAVPLTWGIIEEIQCIACFFIPWCAFIALLNISEATSRRESWGPFFPFLFGVIIIGLAGWYFYLLRAEAAEKAAQKKREEEARKLRRKSRRRRLPTRKPSTTEPTTERSEESQGGTSRRPIIHSRIESQPS